MPGSTDYSYGQQSLLARGASSLRQRCAAMAVVVGLHVLGGFVLLTQKIVVEHASPPMIVSFLEAPIDSEPPPPTVVPRFESPPLPMIVMPELTTVEETAPTAITVVAIHVPSEAASTAIKDAMIEARFDVDYLNNPQPTYPSISRRMREEGLVVLKVKVRADGTADVVLVQQRSGSIRLDDAALAAVKHWRFIPARRGDQVVESWVLVPIEFELKA